MFWYVLGYQLVCAFSFVIWGCTDRDSLFILKQYEYAYQRNKAVGVIMAIIFFFIVPFFAVYRWVKLKK